MNMLNSMIQVVISFGFGVLLGILCLVTAGFSFILVYALGVPGDETRKDRSLARVGGEIG
jgi:hypothetical protein